MKIGVFDSGLGGLFTLKALAKSLSEYDYIYLGDTKRLPYGNRSHDTIYEFLKEGVDFLFSKDCAIVIVACNTASAEALRTLQQKYLPGKYPDKKVLGMIVPIVEELTSFKTVGLIGTSATISSGAYISEGKKRAPKTKIIPLATPLLVPLIENDGKKFILPVLKEYLKYFDKKKIEALILGCTHYPIIKKEILSLLPKGVKIISQDTVIPGKAKEYLKNHPEIEKLLSKKGSRKFFVTDITKKFKETAAKWFGKEIKIEKVAIEKTIDAE